MTAPDEAVRSHLAGFWPDRTQEEFVWDLGPMRAEHPHFRVRRIAPGSPADSWVYATVGASRFRDRPVDGREFMLLSAAEEPLHVETLAMVTRYHASPEHRLAFGHVVPIGRPWMEGSEADHLLVSLPYPFGPRLEHLEVPGGGHVQFLWLVPITASEAAFARTNGLEALESRLEDSGVDVLAVRRPSVM